MGLSQFDERVPIVNAVAVPAASTPGNFNMCSNTPLPGRLDSLLMSTNDTAAVVVELRVEDPFANTALIATVSVPAGSGYTPGIPAVDLLTGLPPTVLAIVLPFGGSLFVNFPNPLTAGTEAALLPMGGSV